MNIIFFKAIKTEQTIYTSGPKIKYVGFKLYVG